MQRVLACIDANRAGDYSICLAGRGDVILVLLKPPPTPRAVGEREHGRSIPFSDIELATLTHINVLFSLRQAGARLHGAAFCGEPASHDGRAALLD